MTAVKLWQCQFLVFCKTSVHVQTCDVKQEKYGHIAHHVEDQPVGGGALRLEGAIYIVPRKVGETGGEERQAVTAGFIQFYCQ